jgi:hypothetical protein
MLWGRLHPSANGNTTAPLGDPVVARSQSIMEEVPGIVTHGACDGHVRQWGALLLPVLGVSRQSQLRQRRGHG